MHLKIPKARCSLGPLCKEGSADLPVWHWPSRRVGTRRFRNSSEVLASFQWGLEELGPCGFDALLSNGMLLQRSQQGWPWHNGETVVLSSRAWAKTTSSGSEQMVEMQDYGPMVLLGIFCSWIVLAGLSGTVQHQGYKKEVPSQRMSGIAGESGCPCAVFLIWSAGQQQFGRQRVHAARFANMPDCSGSCPEVSRVGYWPLFTSELGHQLASYRACLAFLALAVCSTTGLLVSLVHCILISCWEGEHESWVFLMLQITVTVSVSVYCAIWFNRHDFFLWQHKSGV